MTKDQVRSTEEVLKLALEELENCADLLKMFEAPIDSCVGATMLQAEAAITTIKQAVAAPVQEPNEADELLRHLGLDPQTYRTDGGTINRMKVKAALAHPDEYPRMGSMDAMVNRFLTWPVPASVYPDGTPGQPGRAGTNLLTADEARQMLEHVVGTPPAAQPAVPLTDEQIDAIMTPLTKNTAYSWRAFARAIEAAHGITSKD